MARRSARHGNWLADIPQRDRQVSAARVAYPTLTNRRRQAKRPRHIFTAQVPIPGEDSRLVTAEFDQDLPTWPFVFADGPTDSPHRFPDRGRTHLCIWHHNDPPERRWVPDDGLMALFGMAQHHLFKESWWRETGEWLGDEAPHDADQDKTQEQP